MTLQNTLVCDIGTSSIKVGHAGNLTPNFKVPCLVENSRRMSSGAIKSNAIRIGYDALEAQQRDKLPCRYPMDDDGVVRDWNALELLLHYAFEGKMGVKDYSKYKLLIPKPHAMTKADLERLMGFLFVKLGFQAITMHEQAALVLYTQGVETGIVVEAGDGGVRIVPVYMGHAIPKLDKRFPVGGRALSKYLMKLLRLRGYNLDAIEYLESARQVKERLCYVALDRSLEHRLAEETTVLVERHALPDGTSLTLGRERFEAAEALFEPSMLDIESCGLADVIFDVIQEAGIDCRADLYQNIILSGGTTLLPGLRDRLESDLQKRYLRDILNGDEAREQNWNFGVHAPNARDHLVFEGAALFGDLISNESEYWVTKKEYDMFGIQFVLDKCKN
jgi:actin-related protein 2